MTYCLDCGIRRAKRSRGGSSRTRELLCTERRQQTRRMPSSRWRFGRALSVAALWQALAAVSLGALAACVSVSPSLPPAHTPPLPARGLSADNTPPPPRAGCHRVTHRAAFMRVSPPVNIFRGGQPHTCSHSLKTRKASLWITRQWRMRQWQMRMIASHGEDPLRERYRRERATREDRLLRDAPASAAAQEDEAEGDTEALNETAYGEKDRNFRVRNGKFGMMCDLD